MRFLREEVLKFVFKGHTSPRKNEHSWKEKRCCYLVFFCVLLLFLYFLSLLYIIGEREFFLTQLSNFSFIYLFIFIYIHILELPLEVWRVKIDLGLHSSNLFLPHLFICILFMFFLGFLRFILFYIYYIWQYFSSWIFYQYLLFKSLPFRFINSLYSTFCMCAHLPKFFCSSLCLSF